MRHNHLVSASDMTSVSPWIIPFFLPEMGCPRRCLFCNQQVLSGKEAFLPNGAAVRQQLTRWLGFPRDPRRRVELAFYGGSFTGLPRALQEELLHAATPELASGAVSCIRVSTRPDLLEDDAAAFLCRNGVRVVELGVQSLDERVLTLSGRGYRPAVVVQALARLRRAGLLVGCHLMVGLPGETTASLLDSARTLVSLQPDSVRLHPVLVLAGTALARMMEHGAYRPLSLFQAIARVARLKQLFDQADIPVLRMGLQPTAELEKALLAGPYHPAFGELVMSRLMFRQMRQLLHRGRRQTSVRLAVNPRDISALHGPGRVNLARLESLGLRDRLHLVFDAAQPRHLLRPLHGDVLSPAMNSC